MHAPTLDPITPGFVFQGRYRVLRCIEAGAMGAVYEAVDERTRSARALKVMLAHLAQDPDMRVRFAQEARIVGEIASDHIVRVSDAGVDAATGAPFIVMGLLRGDELGQLLKRSGPLSAEEGTPLYMAPEQILGHRPIGPRTDVYALGHVAFTLLVGKAYWRDEAATKDALLPLLSRVSVGAVEPPSVRSARWGVPALPPAFRPAGWRPLGTSLLPLAWRASPIHWQAKVRTRLRRQGRVRTARPSPAQVPASRPQPSYRNAAASRFGKDLARPLARGFALLCKRTKPLSFLGATFET